MAHIARHEIIPDEVEEVCHGRPIVQDGYGGRSLVIGPTNSGRMLTVVIDPDPLERGVYYPVTARPASRREREIYQQQRGGETE